MNNLFNGPDGARNIPFQIMFPDVQDVPSKPPQFLRRFSVSLLVFLNLLRLEAIIRFGLNIMFWTAMPETTIHKDGHLLADKDNVRRAMKIAPMQPETKTARMQRRTQLSLRLRITDLVCGSC